MTPETIDDWIRELLQKARQYSIVYVQLGHAAERLKEPIRQAPGMHVSTREYLDAEAISENQTVFIHDLEAMRQDRGQRFGQLRDRVMREASTGTAFVLVSGIPRTAYP